MGEGGKVDQRWPHRIVWLVSFYAYHIFLTTHLIRCSPQPLARRPKKFPLQMKLIKCSPNKFHTVQFKRALSTVLYFIGVSLVLKTKCISLVRIFNSRALINCYYYSRLSLLIFPCVLFLLLFCLHMNAFIHSLTHKKTKPKSCKLCLVHFPCRTS